MNCRGEPWIGLYKKDYDLATEESAAHPAKASWGLAFKIIEHLEELGLLKHEQTLLDSMAGTGRYLIAGAVKGYAGIGIELEPSFCNLLNRNISYVSEKLNRKLDIEVLQGDSRNLSSLLSKRGLIGITSPPYAGCEVPDNRKTFNNTNASLLGKFQGAYQAEGQVANLSDKGYSSAMFLIYSEIIKVADILAVVVRDPTKKGKIYPLGDITCKLMEEAGWRIHCIHQAKLFEEISKTNLFGETTTKPKGRIGFFKLLSYMRGSPVSNHETIIIATS